MAFRLARNEMADNLRKEPATGGDPNSVAMYSPFWADWAIASEGNPLAVATVVTAHS
jgi:hypothetical protein